MARRVCVVVLGRLPRIARVVRGGRQQAALQHRHALLSTTAPRRWIANCVGFVIMLLLGEWLCVRKEMQDIPVGAGPREERCAEAGACPGCAPLTTAPVAAGCPGAGLHKWGSRKESGAIMTPLPLPTKDPDLPPRPRLRTASASTMQRPAAAAAAGAAGAVPAASSSAVPPAVVPRPGSALSLQMVPLASGAAARDSFGGGGSGQRIKKVLSRASSSSNVAGKTPAAAAEGDNAV